MARHRLPDEEIWKFILENIDQHPGDLARLVARRFGVSRQTAVAHLARLGREGVIEFAGRTKARRYSLKDTGSVFALDVSPALEEDIVWRNNVLPELKGLPPNVLAICEYGFTEVMNNVVDHSESAKAIIMVTRNALRTRIQVSDSGVGIFDKIRRALGLHDARHALLELAKGKLTTDQSRHTGEGVFFTSRIFDEFRMMSGTLFYQRIRRENDDWLIEAGAQPPTVGTAVEMQIRNDATQTLEEVFDEYASEDSDYGFTRTHVPIRLAMYEGEQMLSRSQAKRILARVERFREVLLDFTGVATIGQAFADEIFRVFAREHPEVHVVPTVTTPEIDRMIARARATGISNGL